MNLLNETYAATNVGAGQARDGRHTKVHTHTAEYSCSSGTGNATVTVYGQNVGDAGWNPVWTATFTGASNGDKATPDTLWHAYDQYKAECSVLTGTGAQVHVAMTGA